MNTLDDIKRPRIQFLGSGRADAVGFVTDEGKLLLVMWGSVYYNPSKKVFRAIMNDISTYKEDVFEDFFQCMFVQVPWESNILEMDRAKFRTLSSTGNMIQRLTALDKLYEKFLKDAHDEDWEFTKKIDDTAIDYLYDCLVGLCSSIKSQPQFFFE